MAKLEMTRDASDFLGDLSKMAKQYAQVCRKVLALMGDATPADSEDMQGFPYRRVDVGEYRVIYKLDGDTVLIVLIGKRNGDEVYQKLKRMDPK